MRFVTWIAVILALAGAMTGAATASTLLEALDAKIASTTDKENLANLYIARGEYHSRQKNSPSAILDFTKALEQLPQTPDQSQKISQIYYERGIEFVAINYNTEALDDFNNAIRLWPKDKPPDDKLGTAYYQRAELQRRRLQGQVKQKTIFQQAEPDNSATYKLIIADLTEALRLWPATFNTRQKIGALYMRGMFLSDDHQRKLALADFDEILRLDSSLQAAKDARQTVLLQMQENGERSE